MNQTNQLIYQLNELIESEEAYGSPIEILNFNIKPNNDIDGKFKDNWNNRVFSFTILKDKIGYKPAINLAKFDSSDVSDRFDAFSQGYLFLEREDGKPRTGKSKCTAVSYSCGKSCIQLQKTCWIDDLGNKPDKPYGSVASISQGRIDKIRTLARYLAANGNNQWSKYGSADVLQAKAKELERVRGGVFAKGVKLPPVEVPQQSVNEIKSPIDDKITTMNTNVETKTKNSSKSKSAKVDLSKGFIVSKQEINNIETNIGKITFFDKNGNDVPPHKATEYSIGYDVNWDYLGYKGKLAGRNQTLTLEKIKQENSSETVAKQKTIQVEKKERNKKYFDDLNNKLGNIGTVTTYGISIHAMTNNQEDRITKVISDLKNANIEHKGSWADSNSNWTYQLRVSTTERNLKKIAEFVKSAKAIG